MIKSRTLLVWPNPFHALDHEGHPAGVLSYEPTGDGVKTFDARRFIGATLESRITAKAIEGTAQQSMQRTWFKYLDEPTEVPETPYYKHAIARGEIFAADAASAARAGITIGFVEPSVLLERCRKEAVEAYERNPPHEDLDGLAPDELVKFTFGPMTGAVEQRKLRDAEAKKLEEGQAKRDEEARAAEAKGIADRALARAKRDEEQKKEEAAKTASAEETAKNEAAVMKAADEAKAKVTTDATKTTTPDTRTRKGES